MCGTKEILLKNVRSKGNPIEKMCGSKEILLKSWKKPHNLSPILAPAPGTPGNPGKNLTICGPSPGPGKSWKKPHNLRTIPGTRKILEKTSQFADHPRDPENPGTSQYYAFAY